MAKKFQKRKEDFVCGHCKREVVGDGYTNHCPDCLWSKHVDINPGDRLATCEGMMMPLAIEKKGADFVIVHECERCKFRKNNRMGDNDSFDTAAQIVRKNADKILIK